MANKYTINIDNESGNLQQYAVFSEPPKLNNVVNQQVFSNVFANATTPNTSQGKIDIYESYEATVGTSTGSPGDGIVVSVSQTRPVTLGYQNNDGKAVPGTSLKVYAPAPNALSFASGAPPTPEGMQGCFEMITDTSFTSQDATNNHMVMGMTTKSSQGTGVSATFIARPNEKFQVQPITTFYVAAGEYVPGTIVNYNHLTVSKVEVNFTQLNTNVANIKHMPNGALILL